MATLDAILAAETVLRESRVPVTELRRGDRVVIHRALPGEIVCTISVTGTVSRTRNTTPQRIHPTPWWFVEILLDDGTMHRFECSARFSVLRDHDAARAADVIAWAQDHREADDAADRLAVQDLLHQLVGA